ncbi:MAG: SRPBCC domain-containing protein [Saprospiraceae bacterium]|nr:SRPBCC domain-containing protein [Saprospiraceae bacterium]
MEQKTKVNAEDGKQEILITREFELPLALLFKAYVEPEIVEQWMGTKVLKLESKKHGSYQFETTDTKGNKYGFNGVIHEFKPNQKIIRTFEMENMPFGVQLEVLEFEELTEDSSKLQKKVIYESVSHRDENLKLPFVQGINIAHNRLQEITRKFKIATYDNDKEK